MSEHLLTIESLAVDFHTPEGIAHAVDGVSLNLAPGETVGLVGESGCGKSVTSMSIMGLIPSPPGEITSGSIVYKGQNLLQLNKEELRRIRGREIAMIFQEPMTSLNPVLPIGRQVAEALMVHQGLSKKQAYAEAVTWLDHVKIPAAKKHLADYPHQLSGGMRQRVMIAMAMANRPGLLIADEPTTALDVTIQAQILSLISGLKNEMGMSVLLITHNLGVVAQMAQRVVVMYAGQVMESADVMDLFDQPFHPYTRGLLKSMPRLSVGNGNVVGRLNEIPGTVPRLTEEIVGCKFADRCDECFDLCRVEQPDLFPIQHNQYARCWLKTHPEQRKNYV